MKALFLKATTYVSASKKKGRKRKNVQAEAKEGKERKKKEKGVEYGKNWSRIIVNYAKHVPALSLYDGVLQVFPQTVKVEQS